MVDNEEGSSIEPSAQSPDKGTNGPNRKRTAFDYSSVIGDMGRIQDYERQRKNQLDSLIKQVQAVRPVSSVSPIPLRITRPEPELLRGILWQQAEQNQAITRMAEGIEKLAIHAEAEEGRGINESKKTSAVIALTVTVVVLTAVLVVLTIELLSRHHG